MRELTFFLAVVFIGLAGLLITLHYVDVVEEVQTGILTLVASTVTFIVSRLAGDGKA